MCGHAFPTKVKLCATGSLNLANQFPRVQHDQGVTQFNPVGNFLLDELLPKNNIIQMVV